MRVHDRSSLLPILYRILMLASLPLLFISMGAQRLTTVAGNGTDGHVAAPDGGPAARAELEKPYGTAVDRAGNLYIAERAHHRIRRVDAVTGAITTVAGTGQAGYRDSDEDGPALNAELSGPRAVAVDTHGNLYIADTDNQRIRKIEATTHVIHTITGTGTAGYFAAQGGGPAEGAEINNPCGLAFDAEGNLYIADTGNHRVRRIEVHTGIITTVAGNGTAGYRANDEGKLATRAKLNAPYEIGFDAAGDLYIADMDEHHVRRVDAFTGAITTVAGSGIAGYIAAQDGEAALITRLNKPQGVAIDPLGGLYIADSASPRVRKVESAKGAYVAVR